MRLFGAIVLTVVCCPLFAAAQNTPASSTPPVTHVVAVPPRTTESDWEKVKQLKRGLKIEVDLNDAKSYRGELRSTSDEEILVRLTSGETTFTRQNIRRVSVKGQSHRLRNTLIGAGLGAGFGLGVTSSGCDGFCRGAGAKAIGALIFGLPGAGIGAIISPTSRWHEVYRAP